MNQLDVLLLVLLVPFAFRGFSRGLCRESFGLAGMIAGVLAAGALGGQMAKVLLDERLVTPGAAQPVGWVAVFAGVWLLGAILGRIADRLVRALMLGGLNRLAGTLFGAAKGAALLGFTLHLIEQTAPASGMSRVIAASRLGRPLEQVAGRVAERGRELGIAPAGQHA